MVKKQNAVTESVSSVVSHILENLSNRDSGDNAEIKSPATEEYQVTGPSLAIRKANKELYKKFKDTLLAHPYFIPRFVPDDWAEYGFYSCDVLQRINLKQEVLEEKLVISCHVKEKKFSIEVSDNVVNNLKNVIFVHTLLNRTIKKSFILRSETKVDDFVESIVKEFINHHS